MPIKLSFLGATGNVTGSRYLLEAGGLKLLVDCGLYQERQFRERNWLAFAVKPETIDAVLLTHAHLDHCGLLPKLVKEGFAGEVYCTAATAEIAKIVLLDSAKLQEEDAEYKLRRHKKEGRTGPRPVVPLYTAEDALACSGLFAPVRYKQTVGLGDGIDALFNDAGHILGSSSIKIRVKEDGQERSILFSGDLGRWDTPIVRDPQIVEQADYVVVESTYGDRVHENNDHINEAFADVINQTHRSGGKIIIPSFAIERSQEVLYRLNELQLADKVPHLMVFLDSPMAISVTEVFENHPELFDEQMNDHLRRHTSPFDVPNLKMSRTTAESKAINTITGTVMVIAGSGMCTGGRVKHHLFNNITRPECTVLFVGYQAVGTLGRSILQGDSPVRILGQKLPVKANITRINGFSAHADRDEILRWLSGMSTPPRQVFVTHGEPDSAASFGKYVHEKLGWNSSVPQFTDTVELA